VLKDIDENPRTLPCQLLLQISFPQWWSLVKVVRRQKLLLAENLEQSDINRRYNRVSQVNSKATWVNQLLKYVMQQVHEIPENPEPRVHARTLAVACSVPDQLLKVPGFSSSQ